MRPLVVELSAVTVRATPTECPDRDDPRARALWERAAAHYDVALSAYGVRTDVQLFAALVPLESLGVIDTTRLQAWAVAGGYSSLAFATRLATQRNYYAVPASRIPWRRFGRWHYALLESSRAWHFADSLFAVMNRMAFVETSAGDTAIAFCSSGQDRPYIRGRLRRGRRPVGRYCSRRRTPTRPASRSCRWPASSGAGCCRRSTRSGWSTGSGPGARVRPAAAHRRL